MSDKNIEEVYERHWLNEDRGTAYVILDMTASEDWKFEDGRNADVDIEIKDCNRQCAIEFSYYSEKTYNQRKVKIRHLIEQLQKVEDFMLRHPYVKGVIERKDADPEDAPLNAILANANVHGATDNVIELPSNPED